MLDRGEDDDWFGSRFIVIMTVLAFIGIFGAICWLLTAKKPIIDLDVFTRQELRHGLRADRRHGHDPLRLGRADPAVLAAAARLHGAAVGPHPVAGRHRGDHPDPHRRAAHEGRADPLHRDDRLHHHGLRPDVFQPARPRQHRLLDAGEDALVPDGGAGLPLRADLDHRLSDAAAEIQRATARRCSRCSATWAARSGSRSPPRW